MQTDPSLRLRVTVEGPAGQTLLCGSGRQGNPSCHAERSEAARCPVRQTLRCAQGDKKGPAGETLRCAQGDSGGAGLFCKFCNVCQTMPLKLGIACRGIVKVA